jgi:transcriptional regulator with XRE-family HTH domain
MLAEDRKREGWSMGQVAWRLGVSVREYRELETGAHWPNWETWDRILQAVRLAADIPLLGAEPHPGFWTKRFSPFV